MTESNDLSSVFKAILDLKKLDWFRLSVRDIRAYRVEDWSDLTAILKES